MIQHDDINYLWNFVQGRGNVTKVRRWDVNHETDIALATASTVGYNTAGSAMFSRDPLGHQTTISYNDSFSSNGINTTTPPGPKLAYPTMVTVNDPAPISSTVKYNYDLGAVTRNEGPPPAGHQQGAIQTTEYDSAGRVKRVTNAVNGAYTRFVYPPSQTFGNKFTTIQEGQGEAYSATVFDGAGRVRAVAGDFPNSTGHYSGQFTCYDVMGRAVQSTNPTEMNQAWAAAGDDSAGWHSSLQTYDWKGRPLVTTNTDGTTKEASYGGCGCAGGAVVTLTDEGTLVAGVPKRRQQKIYADVLGRTVKTEVLNWQGGSIYATPFISLYFLSGRIYESVATVVSSWMGAMVGTGIEKYSAEAAASINRQAESTQYHAGYQADVTRSAGQWEAGNMRAQGQRTAQLASIQAALTGQVAATQGAATTQRMIIQAAAGFQKSQVGSEVARNIRDTNIGASREVGSIIAGAKRDLYMNAGNTSAAKIDQGVSLVNAMVPPEVPVVRGLVEIPKYDAITKRNRTANEATTGFSAEMVQNQELVAGRIAGSAQRYQTEMNQAIDRQAGAQVAGVNAGAGQAIGGYQRGASEARSGVDQNYRLEVGANKQIYVSQVDAAGQIRNAGLEAAKLRQAAAVISAVGREISREVGQGMRMRF